MPTLSGEAVADIRRASEGALRVAATYDREGYDVRYARDDVEPRIADVADEVHDELVIQGLGREYLESLFDGGGLQCSMHRFDEMTAFHFIEDEFTGLFVSVDSDADLHLATFANTCREQLED